METSGLDAPLTRAEFDSLCEAAMGPVGRFIPIAHKRHLLRVGYLKRALGGLFVTRLGHMRVDKGNGPIDHQALRRANESKGRLNKRA